MGNMIGIWSFENPSYKNLYIQQFCEHELVEVKYIHLHIYKLISKQHDKKHFRK